MRELVAAVTCVLLAACTSADGTHPPAAPQRSGVSVGIVWWPAIPAKGVNALASDVEACLSARIADVAPEISIVPQRTVRDALYPLLEPALQPASEAAFADLLAREDVHARLARRGLRHLVAFSGETKAAESGGFILCGAGYGGGGCLGFAWRGETTALDAALWSLDDGARVQRERATAEGTLVMPAFVVPIPIPARTMAEACRELGTRIAHEIRRQEAEGAE